MRDTQDVAAQENDDTRSAGAVTGRHHRVTMPSTRHSVLAKAQRYRAEPERVDILVDEPLVAIVHGLHADHTVRHTEQGLVCSCERFRRGEGVCAHVLAVEQRRSTSASSVAVVADFGEAGACAINPGAAAGGAAGLFARVLVPVWDSTTDSGGMTWARTLSAVLRATRRPILLVRPDACIGGSEAMPAPGISEDGEAPSAGGRPRSRDVHAPSPANTDRPGTVPVEHR